MSTEKTSNYKGPMPVLEAPSREDVRGDTCPLVVAG